MNKIFTIGHSTNTLEEFLGYLLHYHIDTIVDVRSVPYSQFANQFNKEQLSVFLKKNNVIYIAMGDNLGARYEKKELLFEDGTVDFSKVRNTEKFQQGINRIKIGMQKGYNIALMCSEKNPLECHRFSLISNYLYTTGYKVNHIVGHDNFEHQFLEKKLLDYYKTYHKISTDIRIIIKFHLMQQTFFNIDNINEHQLYCKLNKAIGYHPNSVKTKMV